MFNLKNLKANAVHNNRYERRLAILTANKQETVRIESVVENAITNIKADQRSFIIYGEPQSGKTEMMIALTARLLDEGFKIIIALLNDSVQLLGQNLERFQRSGLSPAPKKFSEILSPEIKIGDHQWVIFCKKNSKDLQKLITKLRDHKECVIIDDEADYATPNSKINKNEASRINELTRDLIGDKGIYIGVTATPARLDLNRTHKNQNENWIDFPPHSNYTGQDVFFPTSVNSLPYCLTLLPDTGDDPKYLRNALFSFMVNVGYLNTQVNQSEINYSFLIHTSGKKADHSDDYKRIVKIFETLRDSTNSNHESYYKNIWEIAKRRYSGKEDQITAYVLESCDRNNIVVMNSDKEVNAADNKTATSPAAPFTIVIGGNIISRGVTFDNLLSMFFTRDVRHKLQQDTYIQRARMFGSRGNYLKYFELVIPRSLYLDWQKCFIFHRLSLASRKQNKTTPVWLDGERVAAVAANSIDQANVVIDSGEMSFALFNFEKDKIDEILIKKDKPIEKIKAISKFVGEDNLPTYLISFIESFLPTGNSSIAIHEPKSIANYTDKLGETDKASITRSKGFIGNRELELSKYPDAVHHLNILFNADGMARVFYKYKGNIRFLKTSAR